MEKSVIEEASVELLELFEKVSNEAIKEKKAVPAINKMIYYWTRKPLIVGRAVTLASTLDNVDTVKELLGLYGDKRAYTNKPNRELYQKRLGKSPSKIAILDPFAGTGNLIFPALELGLDVTSTDYNPLAYLIEKATLEFPNKSGFDLSKEFENIANKIIDETENEVGRFYQQKHLAYLWLWCITCPHCSQRVPLTNQMFLAKTSKKKVGVRFTPTGDKDFTIELIQNMTDFEGKKFTQKKGKAQCISCEDTISYETMTQDIAKNKDREMIAIQIQKTKGRDYILPTKEDKKQYFDSVKFFKIKEKEFENEDLIPKEEIKPDNIKENRLWKYGIKHWNEFYSERQLLVLSFFLKQVKQFSKSKTNSNVIPISIFLSFLLGRLVFSYTHGVYWNPSAEEPEPTLAFRRPAFVMNQAEINPFEKVRGSLKNNIKNITKAIEFSTRLNNSSKCKLESVTELSDTKYDLIITDPPYGDDVQYGEQSEFFYVWLYRALKDVFPELPSKVSLEEDFCECYGRFGDKKLASQFFEVGLKKSFVSMNKKLKDDGLLVVFFAHSSVTAWNQLLKSIREGKFRVVSSYAIHTENSGNVIAQGKTSFMSSIVVVCRKITEDSEEFFEDIIPQVEDNIKEMIEKIPDDKLLTLPITDLLIMVYGKVLESCTKHTILKSRKKDFAPDFETLISDARSFIMKQLVTKLTHKSMSTVGPKMAFYLLTKIFHRGIITGDNAIKIAQTYGVDLLDLENDNVLKHENDVLRLYYLSENEMNYPADNVDKNNLHQQLCYLSYLADTRGAEKITSLLARDNFREDNLKQIVSLISKSYNLRRNKGESLNSKENKEIEILQILSDIMGLKREDGLDSYF